jgi:hypothetical protein
MSGINLNGKKNENQNIPIYFPITQNLTHNKQKKKKSTICHCVMVLRKLISSPHYKKTNTCRWCTTLWSQLAFCRVPFPNVFNHFFPYIFCNHKKKERKQTIIKCFHLGISVDVIEKKKIITFLL